MYDSTEDTKAHIRRVQQLAAKFAEMLNLQTAVHDFSKLYPPEKEVFDEFTPKLKDSTYGSEEYKGFLVSMKPALDRHYTQNRHHPEHFKNGVNGMDLIDLIEMYCDWKAATERHANGSMEKSIQHNAVRFDIGPQLTSIFENTKKSSTGW
jgi:hypothetical protein